MDLRSDDDLLLHTIDELAVKTQLRSLVLVEAREAKRVTTHMSRDKYVAASISCFAISLIPDVH